MKLIMGLQTKRSAAPCIHLMLANRLGPELLNMKQNLEECLGPARQPAWQAFQACQEVAHQGEI